MNFEAIMKFLRYMPKLADGPEIIERALKIRLRMRRIALLEKQFDLDRKKKAKMDAKLI